MFFEKMWIAIKTMLFGYYDAVSTRLHLLEQEVNSMKVDLVNLKTTVADVVVTTDHIVVKIQELIAASDDTAAQQEINTLVAQLQEANAKLKVYTAS